jgi:hypothetical protein
VVQALSFNVRFLDDLLTRVEENVRPEEVVPPQIIFTEAEIDRMGKEIRAVVLPVAVLRRVEFFTSQFEFLEVAAEQFEYKTKDTARLAGSEWNALVGQETGKDRLKDIGLQTKNGLSVRTLMTLLHYSKALAYFRGTNEVTMEDMRQILPFVLHDKLVPDTDAPFFEQAGNKPLRTDRVSWLRRLFDLACAEYDRLDLDRTDPVGALDTEFRQGLDGLSQNQVRQRLTQIERHIGELAQGRKLYGHLYEDILKLKYLHQRYTNYLRWLQTR